MINKDNYCVLGISGKQYLVSPGEELVIDKIPGKAGSHLELKEVLLLKDGKLSLGQPVLKKVTVKLEIIEQFKDKKIRIATFKAKSRYHKVKGHRQQKTKIKILKINS